MYGLEVNILKELTSKQKKVIVCWFPWQFLRVLRFYVLIKRSVMYFSQLAAIKLPYCHLKITFSLCSLGLELKREVKNVDEHLNWEIYGRILFTYSHPVL